MAFTPSPNKMDITKYNTELSIQQQSNFTLPSRFNMSEDLISWGMDMSISSGGSVKERVFSWGKKFELLDNNKKLVASAREEVFSYYTDIKIKDSKGVLIGSIEQEISESMFSIYSIYSIKDKNGKIIGKSRKLSFFKTDIDIDGYSGGSVRLDKKLLSLTDSWNVTNTSKIDSRIIAFIPAFVSSAQRNRKDD